MKVAVTYENNEIFMHYGHTENFMVYSIIDSKITKKELLPTNGNGHGFLASFLKANEIDVVICGGIGGPAVQALEKLGMTVYSGACGDVDASVNLFLSGKLKSKGIANCHHHDHEEGSCSSHSCDKQSNMSLNKNIL